MSTSLMEVGTAQMAQVIDLVGQPAFVIDVEGPEEFRFAHVNSQLTSQTGLQRDQLLGQRPQDVMPERLANSLIANYERCRAAGRIEIYEEQIELTSQTQWWRTTLSPVRKKGSLGDIVRIIGVAADITVAKTREMDLTKALSAQSSVVNELRACASNAMLDSQGPIRELLSCLENLRDGFVDLGDGKLDDMDRVQKLAIDAIIAMDEVLHGEGFTQHKQQADAVINLGHMCANIAALIDPASRISMQFPSATVEANWATTQIILRCVLEQAAKRAISAVTVHVEPDGPQKIALTITNDSGHMQDSEAWIADVSEVARMVKERGGEMTVSSRPSDATIVRVTLLGRMHEQAETGQISAMRG